MIQLEVWGNYALLSRPELKVERVSYEVLTPSAARGIVEAIYYHPGLRWKIRKIYVMNPIRFTNIRRNEVKSKILLFRCTQRDAGNRERALPCHAPADRSACSHGVAGRSLCD